MDIDFENVVIIILLICGTLFISTCCYVIGINIKNDNSAIVISNNCISYKEKFYCEKVVE